MLEALTRFLTSLSTLAIARGDVDPDVVKFFQLGALAVRAGDTGRDALRHATARMQTLVDEGRAMTPEEDAELNASIEDKLARAAAVDLPAPGDT